MLSPYECGPSTSAEDIASCHLIRRAAVKSIIKIRRTSINIARVLGKEHIKLSPPPFLNRVRLGRDHQEILHAGIVF